MHTRSTHSKDKHQFHTHTVEKRALHAVCCSNDIPKWPQHYFISNGYYKPRFYCRFGHFGITTFFSLSLSPLCNLETLLTCVVVACACSCAIKSFVLYGNMRFNILITNNKWTQWNVIRKCHTKSLCVCACVCTRYRFSLIVVFSRCLVRCLVRVFLFPFLFFPFYYRLVVCSHMYVDYLCYASSSSWFIDVSPFLSLTRFLGLWWPVI